MSDRLNCPECKTENDGPAEGEHKVTCTNCGLIIVLKKKKSAPAKPKPEADSGPEIKRRSAPTRGRSRAAANEPKAKRGGKKKSRRGAPTSSRATTTLGKMPDLGEEDTGRRRGGRKPKQKMSPAVMYGSVAGVAVVLIAVIYFATKGGDEDADNVKQAKGSKTEVAKSSSEPITADQEPDTTADNSGEETNVAKTETVKKETPKKTKPKKANNEWMSQFFEATPGTTEEQVEAIKKSITVLADLNATRTLGQARDQLAENPRQSIPFLINALMRIDRTNKDDVARGWQTIQVLQEVAENRDGRDDQAFLVIDWQGADTEDGARQVKYRMWAVRTWWKWWNKEKGTWKPTTYDEDG